MKCPYCESEDCKKVSLVFEAGTSAGSFAGVGAAGAGYSGGSALGGGVSVGNTSNQTLLAQRLAPPAKPDASVAIAAGLVTFVALIFGFSGRSVSGVVLAVAAINGLVAVFAGLVYSERQKSYPILLARWQDLWMCLRCGRQWETGADGAPIKAPEADADILQLARQGLKIQAIKLYRDRTGVPLKDAKDYVDSL
jgi:hypothetical protein